MALALTDTPSALPPVELIQRVVPPFEAADAEREVAAFDAGGRHSLRCLEHGLAALGREFSDFERLLDFGCGPARLLRWLGSLQGAVELHGFDVDPDAVAWANANVPFAAFATGPYEPPTAYPDAHFDLVINHSVFTHLDERMQDLWLAELQRVTRPGGLLLLTVHSASQARALYEGLQGAGTDPAPYRSTLETEGILFVREDHFLGSAHPDFYHSTFHAPWYLFEHWHRFFEIRAYLPNGADTQDLLVLERRHEGADPADPIGPPGAPVGATAAAALPSARAVAGAAARRVGARLSRVGGSADPSARRLDLLEHSILQQGERITLLQRDLRQELETLRRERAGS